MRKVKRLVIAGLLSLSVTGAIAAPLIAQPDGVEAAITVSGPDRVIIGKTIRLKVNEKASFRSSDKKIATVDSNGNVKGIKRGTVTITIKTSKETTKKEINVIPADGWYKENGSWYYYKDSKMITGWQKMGKGTSNPDGNSAMHWSYFGNDGILRTGWQELGKGTKNPDGDTKRHFSYFGDNGWLRSGWQCMGKGTSNPDGNSAVHWSYFGSNGWLRTGWVHLEKGTSEPDGNTTPHWSFFGENGWLRTGLQTLGKGTSNPDGNSAKHQSYFNANGWLVVSRALELGEKIYWADGNGWLSDCSGGKFSIGNGRKTILIGDSRTDMAYYEVYCGSNYKNEVWNETKGIERWYAKVGIGIKDTTWFNKTIANVESHLDDSTDVVFLLGYNDLQNNVKYKDYINKKANAWIKKGVKTYFVSVNPTTKSANSQVRSFNTYMKKNLNKNVKFIDTFNNVTFNYSKDGEHYKANTNKAIINYVMTHK